MSRGHKKGSKSIRPAGSCRDNLQYIRGYLLLMPISILDKLYQTVLTILTRRKAAIEGEYRIEKMKGVVELGVFNLCIGRRI